MMGEKIEKNQVNALTGLEIIFKQDGEKWIVEGFDDYSKEIQEELLDELENQNHKPDI